LHTNKKAAFLKKSKSKNSHVGQVRCVAISGDDKYLASGGDDKIIRIWALEDLSHVKSFQGHRGPITSLVFRQGSNDLYSASTDKCIRVGYLEVWFYSTILGVGLESDGLRRNHVRSF
jgi:ribosomal RNA-processing protein 9